MGARTRRDWIKIPKPANESSQEAPVRKDEDDGLLDELQEDIGADYSPHLRAAAGMLSADAQGAVPYLLFSIAKSLEDISYLLSNDSLSVIMESEEEE
jgi:hypothetical protein